MAIDELEKSENPFLQALAKAFENIGIPLTELFWDENIKGTRPPKYAVYYVKTESSALSSSDSEEEGRVSLTVSFYIKGKFRKLKALAFKELLEAGFYGEFGYETYENDTQYNHFDIELEYFNYL